MAVILDVAPVQNNFFADIGYAAYFGESETHQNMIQFLDVLKQKIPEIVKEQKIISRIYTTVDKMLIEEGFSNCHQLYPLSVLGHKVGVYPSIKGLKLPRISFMGFEPEAFAFLLRQNPTAPIKFNQSTPYIADDIEEHISDGFWAIEPHIGKDDIGVKFEEILVVDGDNVDWLSKLI